MKVKKYVHSQSLFAIFITEQTLKTHKRGMQREYEKISVNKILL